MKKVQKMATGRQTILAQTRSKFKAFTLAEVLITLGIIGIVAMMTLPNLINEYKKDVWANQLKKGYSTLSNATTFAIKDNGPITSWNVYSNGETVPETSMKGSEYFAKTYLIPYLSVAKILGATSLDYEIKQLNGNTSSFGSGHYKFILNDGALIMVISLATTSVAAEIYIDTNGAKPPNTWGKDIHEFVFFTSGLYEGKLYPWINNGATSTLINNSQYGCNTKASGNNEYCTIIIMRNSWKIPTKDEYVKFGGTADEYPW